MVPSNDKIVIDLNYQLINHYNMEKFQLEKYKAGFKEERVLALQSQNSCGFSLVDSFEINQHNSRL